MVVSLTNAVNHPVEVTKPSRRRQTALAQRVGGWHMPPGLDAESWASPTMNVDIPHCHRPHGTQQGVK
jgi:hypothetical protein